MKPGDANPFEVLRLDPATPTDEIVRAAALLRQRAMDEASVTAIRWAVQMLTSSAGERRLCELLTHAEPRYDWPTLAAFVAEYRRPPQGTPVAPGSEALLQDLLFDKAV